MVNKDYAEKNNTREDQTKIDLKKKLTDEQTGNTYISLYRTNNNRGKVIARL